MTAALNYPELALLLGRVVLADRHEGEQIKAVIRELHVEGFYGAYNQATGTRVAIYPADIVEVIDAEVLSAPPPEEDPKPLFIYTGTYCSVCDEPQFTSVSGDTCKNGHGGAPGKKDLYPF